MAQQASALLAHFRMTERTVDHGIVTAVRVLDALATTSNSVSGPIDVARVTPEGAAFLDEEAIATAKELVDRWTDMEREVLDKLFD